MNKKMWWLAVILLCVVGLGIAEGVNSNIVYQKHAKDEADLAQCNLALKDEKKQSMDYFIKGCDLNRYYQVTIMKFCEVNKTEADKVIKQLHRPLDCNFWNDFRKKHQK